MSKEISHRCGACCKHRCSGRISDSRCDIFSDRRNCQKSISQVMSNTAKNHRRVEKAGGKRAFELKIQFM